MSPDSATLLLQSGLNQHDHGITRQRGAQQQRQRQDDTDELSPENTTRAERSDAQQIPAAAFHLPGDHSGSQPWCEQHDQGDLQNNDQRAGVFNAAGFRSAG